MYDHFKRKAILIYILEKGEKSTLNDFITNPVGHSDMNFENQSRNSYTANPHVRQKLYQMASLENKTTVKLTLLSIFKITTAAIWRP